MNLIAENQGSSPFVSPVAVEAWDTWFRWRENGTLHDDTVDATWRRVASADVAACDGEAMTRQQPLSSGHTGGR